MNTAYGVVKLSFKTTGNYSTVVSLDKVSGEDMCARCNCKAGAGGCCKHYCIIYWTM